MERLAGVPRAWGGKEAGIKDSMTLMNTDDYGPGRILAILCLSIFCCGVISGAAAPLAEWDWLYLQTAADWAAGTAHPWVIDHPPLYPMFLSLPFRFSPPIPETARFFNAVPVLASAWLCYLTARTLSGRTAGLLASAMFLLNPVTIQGVRSMDSSDSSLLPMMFALLFYVLVYPFKTKGRRGYVLALFFAAAFWAKVTSTLGLAAGLFLYALLFRKRAGSEFLRETLLGTAGGMFVFLLTWTAVALPLWGAGSWAMVLTTPFRYLLQGGAGGGHLPFLGLLLDLARAIFWFSPFLLYLCAVRLKDLYRLGAASGAEHLAAFMCVFYFGGYLFAGGSNYGFPRYHAAISPFLHVFGGIALAGFMGGGLVWRRGLVLAAVLFTALPALYVDPELLINLRLKQLMFQGEYTAILTQVLAPLLAYSLLPLAAAVFFTWRYRLEAGKAVMAAAAAAFFGTGAVLAARQGLAPYSTAYQYGAAGKNEAVAFVLEKVSGGETVLATPEFDYDLRHSGVSVPGWQVWTSNTGIHDFVKGRRPEFIITGWTTQTSSQLEYLFRAPGMRRLLESDYALSVIGTYHVWERLNKSKEIKARA